MYEELNALIKEYEEILVSHPKIWVQGDVNHLMGLAHRLSFTESRPLDVIKYRIEKSKEQAGI